MLRDHIQLCWDGQLEHVTHTHTRPTATHIHYPNEPPAPEATGQDIQQGFPNGIPTEGQTQLQMRARGAPQNPKTRTPHPKTSWLRGHGTTHFLKVLPKDTPGSKSLLPTQSSNTQSITPSQYREYLWDIPTASTPKYRWDSKTSTKSGCGGGNWKCQPAEEPQGCLVGKGLAMESSLFEG